MKVRFLLIAILVCMCAGLPARLARAQAQPSAIVMTVRAGYDGSYRTGEWFPISVEITNNGPDIAGQLEWSFPGQRNDPTFRTDVDLPRGAQKRVSMSAF